MPTIGLTGNFGMGKTTVLQLFRKLGARTINIDDLVHRILERPPVLKKMARELGRDVLKKTSGGMSLDRKLTADRIFSNSGKRKLVEQIIHPAVLREMNAMKSTFAKKDPLSVIVFEVPLLFEAGYEKHFDKTVVVHAARRTAITRLSKKGFSSEEAVERMRAQMPISRKRKMADFVIDNNGDIHKTEKRVRRIFEQIRNEIK